MGTVWTIIIAIHVCSLLFLAAYLKRLFSYVKKYPMPESKYTLLFGWVSLSQIVFVYILCVGVFAAGTFAFLLFAT